MKGGERMGSGEGEKRRDEGRMKEEGGRREEGLDDGPRNEAKK